MGMGHTDGSHEGRPIRIGLSRWDLRRMPCSERRVGVLVEMH